MVKKRDPNHDRTRAPIIKGECGSSSQGFKPTCSTPEKKHFWKCLVCTGNFFCGGKDGHKVTFFPNIEFGEIYTKKSTPSALDGCYTKRNYFYAL